MSPGSLSLTLSTMSGDEAAASPLEGIQVSKHLCGTFLYILDQEGLPQWLMGNSHSSHWLEDGYVTSIGPIRESHTDEVVSWSSIMGQESHR